MSRRRARECDSDDDDDYRPDVDQSSDYESERRGARGRRGVGRTESIRAVEGESILAMRDYSKILSLKSDHELRPIWITEDNFIFLEAFSPLYQKAYDFLVAIAEPLSRPEYIHKYKLTPDSLYAAVAVSIDTESIIETLDKLCKTEIPKEVILFIKSWTSTFGKAKLVLKDNSFFIESAYPEVLRHLLKHPTIAEARILVPQPISSTTSSTFSGLGVGYKEQANLGRTEDGFLVSAALQERKSNLEHMKIGITVQGDEDEESEDEKVEDIDSQTFSSEARSVSFMIERTKVQLVKQCALDNKYPLMEEYDFKRSQHSTNSELLQTTH